ncbi:hypothetical protein [Caulobacter sp. 17J80-11]|uniref:hypothetical protein n=1 Tax=Caulobacter sp. 17J80-11 TaxID=2763502 RepID=UPI0016538ABE|nr:hypothetical protein [Caulobacter sp. 17J80-11]MBC6980431.1 hypothetical protein [Caulobacter sp. 17J80-11]
MSYPLSPWPLLLDIARLAVLILLVSKGGRYERVLALMFLPTWLADQLALATGEGGLSGLGDLALLAGHVWVLWRRRPAWLGLAALVQACKTVLVLVFAPPPEAPEGAAGWAVLVLAFAQLCCLAFGVLRQRIGPPAAVPAEVRSN